MATHRLLSSVMSDSDDSYWPVHSSMLSFHDLRGFSLRRPLFTLPCTIGFGKHGQTTTATVPYIIKFLNYEEFILLRNHRNWLHFNLFPVLVIFEVFDLFFGSSTRSFLKLNSQILAFLWRNDDTWATRHIGGGCNKQYSYFDRVLPWNIPFNR